jgi:hypothetical protein
MLKVITIKGKKYPVKLGYNAEKHLQMEHGIDIYGLAGNIAGFETMFFYGIESGCRETGQEFDIKREDVPYILDDVDKEFAQIFKEFYFNPSDTSVNDEADSKKNL